MKFVAFSDAQYYMNPNKSKMLSSGITSWAQMQLDLTNAILQFALEKNVDFVIHNGDLFEEKSRINVPLYNAVWDVYREWSRKLKSIILNTGNHDLYLLQESALKPFSDICDVVTSITSNYKAFNPNEKYHVTPYVVPYGQLENLDIENIDFTKCNILFTHETYDVLFEFDDPKKVCYDKVKDFDFIFNGHIHQPMTYKNLVNIGSININDWGEVGNRRFIYFDGQDYESVDINCPKFIELESLEDITKINSKDFFRIPISKTERGHDIFKLHNVFPSVTKQDEREYRITNKTNDAEMVKQYVDIFSDSVLDNTKLKEVGSKYLDKKE